MVETARPQWEVVIYDPKIKERFLEVVSEQDYYREVIIAKQIVSGSTKLQECSLDSLRAAIINIALTGTTLNPALQQAFLIPRKGKVVLDFSYRGLIGIACSTGNVKSMNAQVVYTWDEFSFEMGSSPFLHYKMNLNPPVDMDLIAKDPKRIWDHVVCAFSTATLLDGSIDFVILPKYKLWKIYQTSEGKDNPKMPWSTWPEEQIRKTAIKYHSKTLPKQGNDRLATAVKILNEHEGLMLKDESKAKEISKRFGLPVKEEPKEEAEELIACPERSAMVAISLCNECEKRKGCPAHE
jgi:recombination protein RecT